MGGPEYGGRSWEKSMVSEDNRMAMHSREGGALRTHGAVMDTV